MNALSRHMFLLSACLGVAFVQLAEAADPDYNELLELPPVPDRYKNLAYEEPMNDEFGDVTSSQGTLAPSADELRLAQEIVARAPRHVPPVQIAAFLLSVARGEYGPAWRPYTRAWPRDAHANPLILEFFRTTKTSPMGDTTAWCAAFVNWCLIQAHGSPYPSRFARPTNSASSSDFRTWGRLVGSYNPKSKSFEGVGVPELGDIAVFQIVDRNGMPDRYHGHVGFLVDMDSQRVKVLGGNQFEGAPPIHAINTKWLRMDAGLQLHSIRTDDGLHQT